MSTARRILLLVWFVAGAVSAAPPGERPAAPAATQPVVRGERFRRVITKTLELPYLVRLPAGYGREGGRRPLLIFLHGSGQCGTDLKKLEHTAPSRFADEHPDEFPFILVAPQAKSEKDWWSLELLDPMLDEVLAKYEVDPDRVYLSGVSMGAYGVWDWAVHRPRAFAAIAPVSGEGNDDLAGELRHVPVWAFHGALDRAVSPAEEERMVNAVLKAGGEAKLTMYPDVGHNAGSRAYADPELYRWLLSQRRWHAPGAAAGDTAAGK